MSAKSVRGEVIGYHQGHEFLQALEKAGLTSEIAQNVINSRGNRSAQSMMAALSGVAAQDNRFELVKSFGITVPEDYDYLSQLNTFKIEHEEEFYYYNSDITDQNFNHSSHKLSPGLKFTVKVFQITEQVTSEDCLAFLKSQKAILVGAQGASLAYEQGSNQLSNGHLYVSFDEKENLWEDSVGYHRVPYVNAHLGGGFGFCLGYFGRPWVAGDCLLCFCDNN